MFNFGIIQNAKDGLRNKVRPHAAPRFMKMFRFSRNSATPEPSEKSRDPSRILHERFCVHFQEHGFLIGDVDGSYSKTGS
jgi:hypothetical protein